jgi:PKHD-type hydroxylase
MLLHVPNVLTPAQVQQCNQLLHNAPWADGAHTAGTQSAAVKNNRQLPPNAPQLPDLQKIVLNALQGNGLFFSAALPKRVFPPLFNCYSGGHNSFGNHIDNAMRTVPHTGEYVRTDLSCTLFLSPPESYAGGELVVQDTYGAHSIKLPAGDAILYPSGSVHRVEPVTSGARIASFFWVESMVRHADQRRILFDTDMVIANLRQTIGDTPEVVTLTGVYHNLMRLWAAG